MFTELITSLQVLLSLLVGGARTHSIPLGVGAGVRLLFLCPPWVSIAPACPVFPLKSQAKS